MKFTEEEEESFYKTWDELERMYAYQPALKTMYYRGRADRSDSWDFGQQLAAPEQAPEDENQTFTGNVSVICCFCSAGVSGIVPYFCEPVC